MSDQSYQSRIAIERLNDQVENLIKRTENLEDRLRAAALIALLSCAGFILLGFAFMVAFVTS